MEKPRSKGLEFLPISKHRGEIGTLIQSLDVKQAMKIWNSYETTMEDRSQEASAKEFYSG